MYVEGPTEETVVKFWQMVWEYQLSIIVMLTRCIENNKASIFVELFSALATVFIIISYTVELCKIALKNYAV